MNEGLSLKFIPAMVILEVFLLLLSLNRGSALIDRKLDDFLPEISPNAAPQPFLPMLAPSPLQPFANNSIPKLSGQCTLNFTVAESLMSITSIDCWGVFAPLLANAICCPQLHATLAILIGQSSKETNVLALNRTVSKICLLDIEQILVGQGAAFDVKSICSVYPSNLTEGSCPVTDVNEFESIVDSSKLLADCKKIDPVKECCDQVCHNAISEAATRIVLKASEILSLDDTDSLPDHTISVNDCKSIVLRWLASKLDPLHAKEVLRGLTNCKVNKVCPLVFPDMIHVAKGCGNRITNTAACCNAMESYVSHLQKQTLITNLQALDCATTLGKKLQKSNITRDVYSLCHISLKDFSLQVAQQESGCLLPSLPSDATLDKTSGISFICDLNDNIPAPWPSSSQLSASSCNKTVKLPALPAAAASAQSGLYKKNVAFLMLFAVSAVMAIILL